MDDTERRIIQNILNRATNLIGRQQNIVEHLNEQIKGIEKRAMRIEKENKNLNDRLEVLENKQKKK